MVRIAGCIFLCGWCFTSKLANGLILVFYRSSWVLLYNLYLGGISQAYDGILKLVTIEICEIQVGNNWQFWQFIQSYFMHKI